MYGAVLFCLDLCRTVLFCLDMWSHDGLLGNADEIAGQLMDSYVAKLMNRNVLDVVLQLMSVCAEVQKETQFRIA